MKLSETIRKTAHNELIRLVSAFGTEETGLVLANPARPHLLIFHKLLVQNLRHMFLPLQQIDLRRNRIINFAFLKQAMDEANAKLLGSGLGMSIAFKDDKGIVETHFKVEIEESPPPFDGSMWESVVRTHSIRPFDSIYVLCIGLSYVWPLIQYLSTC